MSDVFFFGIRGGLHLDNDGLFPTHTGVRPLGGHGRRVSRLERSEGGEPRSGGVSGASVGKSMPEPPGPVLEQPELRFGK